MLVSTCSAEDPCGGGLTLGSNTCFRKGGFGASHPRLIQSALRAFQGLLKSWVVHGQFTTLSVVSSMDGT